MLSPEDNELLTRTGAGTPMGELFRRFWLPVMLAEEIPTRDCPPVRVDVLGEKLVAFRDTEGRIGLIDRHCAHRRVDLFFGRNEECGLRCTYHGWKYDVEGNCIDTPSEPEESALKDKIHLTAYACRERAGFIWAYMGPKKLSPELPELEWARVPDSHRKVVKYLVECNYLQTLEGDIDTVHSGFLHFGARIGSVARGTSTSGSKDAFNVRGRLRSKKGGQWVKYSLADTNYGLKLEAYRKLLDEDGYLWHVTHWMMPTFQLVAGGDPEQSRLCHIQIPLNDEQCIFFMVRWNADRPLTEEERESELGAELIPGTYYPTRQLSNNFLIDRELQRQQSYTGIKGIREQDLSVTVSMGPITDRSKEHLGHSDSAIIMVRKRLLQTVTDLMNGKDPYPAYHGDAYRIRQYDVVLQEGVTPEQGAPELIKARA